ncbi:MAG TPA: LON peptidase substrate-binding domain-containing protein [Thermomicrobiales bacterium]|nr:LON peptidase substrate-binding domain-containing protein [Thermomicrobiales bacterium]
MDQPSLPIFPLGTVLFPHGLMPLHIFEERYRRMLRDTSHNDPAFVVALAARNEPDITRLEPETIGTACRVSGISPRPDGRSDIAVTGTTRVRIGVDAIDWSNGYAVAPVEVLNDLQEGPEEVARRYATIRARFHRYLHALERLIGERLPALEPSRIPEKGSWVIAETLTLHTWERQLLLEQPTIDARLEVLEWFLKREHALLVQTGMIGSPIDFPGRNLTMN